MERLESIPVTRMRLPCRKPIRGSFPVELRFVIPCGRGESVAHYPRPPALVARMTAFLTRVAALLSCAVLVAFAAPPHAPLKVLHTAFLVAETNFDPAATSDLYSNSIIEEILEPPLTYDWLARPAKLKPLTAEALPEITDGGRTYTLRIRKGIYFADDPAFNGRRRELTAKDYEFAFKRLIDPKLRSPNLWLIEGIEGVKAAEEKANRAGRLDYDAPIPGIEVLDRYTLRFHLVKPDY